MTQPKPRLHNRYQPPGRHSRTLITERLQALEDYTVLDGIAMAIRADRGRRGLDQRAYAELVGLSKSQLARLECDPGSIRLRQILDVLDRTRHRLAVHGRDEEPSVADDPHAADVSDTPPRPRPRPRR